MTFDTSLLDRARARRRRRLERERQATLARIFRFLDQHGAKLGISEAYVFGSVTRPGRFHEESDVDVAVEGIDAESFFRAMSLLSSLLERSVDLVKLTECHFADRIKERGIRGTMRS
jgi:hypothetical protein